MHQLHFFKECPEEFKTFHAIKQKLTRTHARLRGLADGNDSRLGLKVKSETIYQVWNAAGAFRSLASFSQTVGDELALRLPSLLFNQRGPDRTDQWREAIPHSTAQPPPPNWTVHEWFTECPPTSSQPPIIQRLNRNPANRTTNTVPEIGAVPLIRCQERRRRRGDVGGAARP